jgi:hypothetical protein
MSRYRWLIVLIIWVAGLLIGYQVDLQFKMNQKKSLTNEASDLQLQLELYQQLQSTAASHPSTPDVHRQSKSLRELLQIIESKKMTLEYVARDERVAVDEVYQLRLRTTYEALLIFIQALARFADKYTVMNFVFALNASGDLQVEMLLKIKKVNAQVNQSLILDASMNPFCFVTHPVVMRGDSARTLQFPVNECRMMGTVLHEQQLSAVILFPDGTFTTVSNQSYLGREGGRVIAIGRDAMTVLLPNNSQFIIS